MRFSQHRKAISFSGLLFCSIILFTGIFFCKIEEAWANSVSGRYIQTSGGTVKLRLNIDSPVPQSIILEQHLPPGTQVLSTSPQARKIESRSGTVIWLFKRVKAGNITVAMKVTPDSSANSVKGSLKYRMPGGGGLIETPISR